MRASIETEGFRVGITDHAYWRAAERFPGFDTVLIEDEVRAALREGRVARTKPPDGFGARKPGFYVWTPDGQRCYVLDSTDRAIVVLSILRAETSTSWRSGRPPA